MSTTVKKGILNIVNNLKFFKMIKTLVALALCLFLALLVQGQAPPGGPPDGPSPPPQSRVARQAGPPGGGVTPSGMTGGTGNLAMQGLGNIPDPTVWIAKGQEIASQFAKGRRAAGDEPPAPPSPPPKDGGKVN